MNKKNKTLLIATLAPIFMFGMAFAGVPLYKLFCEKTGYGGTTKIAEQSADRISNTKIKIDFDANVMPGVDWTFTANQKSIDLRLGENGLAFYKITNNSNRPITAVANYNVTPHKAAIYFQKLECFCFKNQTLAPGESLELPVIFFVDPRLEEDENTKDVNEVTLSYTFFEVKQGVNNNSEQKFGQISSKGVE